MEDGSGAIGSPDTLLELLFAHAPLGLAVVDRGFYLLRVNSAMAAWSGAPVTAQLGRHVRELVPNVWPQLEPYLRRALLGETLRDVTIAAPPGAPPAPGPQLVVTFFPVHCGRGVEGVGVIVSDVTAQHRAVEALRVRNGLYAMLARTGLAAERYKTPEALFHELCTIAVEIGHFRAAWVGVPRDGRLVQVAMAGEGRDDMESLYISLDPGDPRSRGPSGRASLSGIPYVVNDFQTSAMTALWHEQGRKAGFGASGAFPLQLGKERVPVLTLYAATPDFFTDELIATLNEVTPTVSLALDNFEKASTQARLIHDLEERVKEARAFHETVRLLDEDRRPIAEILLAIAERLPAAMEYPGLAEGQVVFDGHAHATPGYLETPWKLSAPVELKDGRRGAVEVAYREAPPTPFLPEEQVLLQTVADMLSGALARRRADERLREVVESDMVRVWEWDLVSDVFQWFGMPADSLLSHPMSFEQVMASIHPDDRDKMLTQFVRPARVAPDGTRLSSECRVGFSGQPPSWRRVVGRVLAPEGAQPKRVLGVSLDINHSRLLEDQLRQSQKLEALGQLAGSIAHDFNNICTVIISTSQLLKRELAGNPDALEMVTDINDAGELAAALVKQILAFSRRQELKPKDVALGAAVRDMLPMLTRLIGKQVTVHNGCEVPGPVVVVDPNQLQQVVLNLAVNAKDAMPRGGKLWLRAGTRRLGAPGEHGAGEEREWCFLEVADSGTGMPPEVKARVFEPFFTTKGEGKGTGLGLSTVYGIVKQSGGFIELESEVDKGTLFRLHFPPASTG